jgi:hypothetical protein
MLVFSALAVICSIANPVLQNAAIVIASVFIVIAFAVVVANI